MDKLIISIVVTYLCGALSMYILLRLSKPRNDRKKAFKPSSMDKIKNDVIEGYHRSSILDAMVRDMSGYTPTIDNTTTPPRGSIEPTSEVSIYYLQRVKMMLIAYKHTPRDYDIEYQRIVINNIKLIINETNNYIK